MQFPRLPNCTTSKGAAEKEKLGLQSKRVSSVFKLTGCSSCSYTYNQIYKGEKAKPNRYTWMAYVGLFVNDKGEGVAVGNSYITHSEHFASSLLIMF